MGINKICPKCGYYCRVKYIDHDPNTSYTDFLELKCHECGYKFIKDPLDKKLPPLAEIKNPIPLIDLMTGCAINEPGLDDIEKDYI